MLSLIIALIIVGFVLFMVNQIPMPGYMINIINAVCALLVVLYVLKVFGVIPHNLLLLR